MATCSKRKTTKVCFVGAVSVGIGFDVFHLTLRIFSPQPLTVPEFRVLHGSQTCFLWFCMYHGTVAFQLISSLCSTPAHFSAALLSFVFLVFILSAGGETVHTQSSGVFPYRRQVIVELLMMHTALLGFESLGTPQLDYDSEAWDAIIKQFWLHLEASIRFRDQLMSYII